MQRGVPSITVDVKIVLRGEGVCKDGDDERELDRLVRLFLLEDEVF